MDFAQLTLKDFLVGLVAACVIALLGFAVTKGRAGLIARIKTTRIKRSVALFGARMVAQGVTNFYTGRDDWLRYRHPPNLSDYIRQTESSLSIACYWMAQGTIEGIPQVCFELAERGVTINIVMISPNGPIPEVLSLDLETPPEVIRQNVIAGIGLLGQIKRKLSDEAQKRFNIKVSTTIPQAAVILIDAGKNSGKIQLEFRPYRAPRWHSFSIELSASTDGRLYHTIESAWQKYFVDAIEFERSDIRQNDKEFNNALTSEVSTHSNPQSKVLLAEEPQGEQTGQNRDR